MRDSLETASESLNKPPEMRCSVDMGMDTEETVASIIDGSVRSHVQVRGKKQVVLRKPYQRNAPTKLIKSLQAMPVHTHSSINQSPCGSDAMMLQ